VKKNLRKPLDSETAETIGLTALAFLAEDGSRLGRFLALTGLGPEELRAAPGSPRLLAAVLDYLLHDETLLLVFTSTAGMAPEMIQPAQERLARMS